MMKGLLLLLLPLAAWADLSNDPPKAGELQPFYPSPFAEQGWAYGSDCFTDITFARWDYWMGYCRYSPNPHAAKSKGQQGWAEVHWHKGDFVPLSATPCVMHYKLSNGHDLHAEHPDWPQCKVSRSGMYPPVEKMD
jgi:hypothetical protein